MSLIIVFFASLLMLVRGGWETPLEATAKISPEERDRISKSAAIASQRAYAPRKTSASKFLAEEVQVQRGCAECDDKDYSDACPLGWAEMEDGRCKAPSAYSGDCAKLQMFFGSSVAAKVELEMTCGICWPCTKGADDPRATCQRDWARPCPHGYAPQDIAYNEFSIAKGITCVADLFYEGECEQEVVFKDLETKQNFAERCQTSWPCRRECEEYAACPNGWQSIGDSLCAAPDSYKVADCPLLHSFHGWSPTMKNEFAQKCAVDWLCASSEEMEAVGCRQLDLSSCPRRWIAKGSGHCTPPPDVQGRCAEAKFETMSAEQKLAFASDCGIDWPCMGEEAVAEPAAAPRATAHVHTERAGPIDASGRIVNMRSE